MPIREPKVTREAGLSYDAVRGMTRGHRGDMTEIEAAWDALRDATPPGWHAEPAYNDYREQWSQWAYDPAEKPHVGHRSRECTAVASSRASCAR